MDRFWSKVAITGLYSCWEWQAYVDWDGYGRFKLDGRKQIAHRVAYQLLRGKIPSELELDHLCRNRSCVNPFHLELVTHVVNVQRGAAKKDFCPRGHPMTPDNLYTPGRCKICTRAHNLQYYHAKKRVRT